MKKLNNIWIFIVIILSFYTLIPPYIMGIETTDADAKTERRTIRGLVFLEAGNAWYSISEYNPFLINRSAGVGVRAFLPMFGMLGIDWGYGFDPVPGKPDANKGQFHFTLGQQF